MCVYVQYIWWPCPKLLTHAHACETLFGIRSCMLIMYQILVTHIKFSFCHSTMKRYIDSLSVYVYNCDQVIFVRGHDHHHVMYNCLYNYIVYIDNEYHTCHCPSIHMHTHAHAQNIMGSVFGFRILAGTTEVCNRWVWYSLRTRLHCTHEWMKFIYRMLHDLYNYLYPVVKVIAV